MSHRVHLRPAQRPDIPRLAEIANAANANSALHRRLAPRQKQYPLSFHQWRLNVVRQRFVTPDSRTIVAEDPETGEILGSACWAIEGKETPLYKRWVAESGWWDWFESKLLDVEKKWAQYVADPSVDYTFTNRFVATFMNAEREGKTVRPPCLHCHLIVVDPNVHARGVGRTLMDWAKELAVKEDLPLYLESNLEATGFYDKNGFSWLGDLPLDFAGDEDPLRIPMYAWEGDERRGRWLERVDSTTATKEQWQWRDDVLPR